MENGYNNNNIAEQHSISDKEKNIENTRAILKKTWIWVLLVLVIILISGLGAYKLLGGAFSAERSEIPVIQNSFGEQAKKIGAVTCAPLFSALGETLTNGSKYSALTFWDNRKPDNHALSALVEQSFNNNNTKGAGLVFTVPGDNQCEGTIMRTVVEQTSCQQVAQEQLPKGSQRQKDLGQTIAFQLPSGGHVILIPATADKCVVITNMNMINKK